jgi:hypothetical protein
MYETKCVIPLFGGISQFSDPIIYFPAGGLSKIKEYGFKIIFIISTDILAINLDGRCSNAPTRRLCKIYKFLLPIYVEKTSFPPNFNNKTTSVVAWKYAT